MNRAGMIVMVLIVGTAATAVRGHEAIVDKTEPAVLTHAVVQKAFAAYASHYETLLPDLIAEALENNPEIQAAQQEREAARQRIAPAQALDDPMLEAGVINAPLASSPFNREDMTMKMIGLSQRLPFPGKRGLRQEVASKDAEAVDQGYHVVW